MKCPICKNTNLEFLHQFLNEPVMQNKLYNSLKEALKAKKASVSLYGCKECGFVFNADFDTRKTEYSSDYDNTQEYSLYFSKYLESIAERLIKKYNLKNKNVVEIGCGKGGFLKLLYEGGIKKIKGFDPSYLNQDSLIDGLVVKQYFNIKNIKNKVDFIVCRHTLEHIPSPMEFISAVTKCLKNRGIMYFELPSLEWIIKNKTFFDFFYEHCNYFSKRSIVKLFNYCGFKNIIFKYGLNGQYFQLEISRTGGEKYNNSSLPLVDFNEISQFLNNQVEKYKKLIKELKNFVIWGGGAKSVTFLTRLNINRQKCQYVIDINPNKQNKFIPITGQEIVSPEILRKKRIEKIIIMNPIYKKEIKVLAKKYNYKGEYILL